VVRPTKGEQGVIVAAMNGRQKMAVGMVAES
jgi:hypothetical protein